MERKSLSLPELGLIAGTRAAAGAGIGLLVSEFLPRDQRRAIGWTLLAVGVLTTVPIAMQLFHKEHKDEGEGGVPGMEPRWPKAASRVPLSAP